MVDTLRLEMLLISFNNLFFLNYRTLQHGYLLTDKFYSFEIRNFDVHKNIHLYGFDTGKLGRWIQKTKKNEYRGFVKCK